MTTRRTLSRLFVGIVVGTLCSAVSGCVIGAPSKRIARAPSVSSVLPGGDNDAAAAVRNQQPTAAGGGPAASMHPAPAPVR